MTTDNICGGVWNDEIVNYELRVPHAASSVTILFDSTLDQAPNDESYGISHFVLTAFSGYNTKKIKSWFSGDNWDAKDFQITRSEAAVSECGDRKIFGGRGKFGARTEIKTTVKLPEKHDWVRIVYTVAFVDTWDAKDWMTLFVDGKPVRSVQRVMGSVIPTAKCFNPAYGEGWSTRFLNVVIEIAHTANQIELAWEDSLDEDKNNESWGISDISVFTVLQGSSTAAKKV